MAEEGQAPPHDPQDLVNTLFPPPPPFYQHFTTDNLTRYASLAGPSGTSKNRALPLVTHDQSEHVRSQEEEEEYQTLRDRLEPPRADWVVEDGRWKCFGEVYTVGLMIANRLRLTLRPSCLFPLRRISDSHHGSTRMSRRRNLFHRYCNRSYIPCCSSSTH